MQLQGPLDSQLQLLQDNSKFSCNECKRRRTKCSRHIPACDLCRKYNRHCLYEKHSRTPLTRKHLTAVEEELAVVKALLRQHQPGFDLAGALADLKNGDDEDLEVESGTAMERGMAGRVTVEMDERGTASGAEETVKELEGERGTDMGPMAVELVLNATPLAPDSPLAQESPLSLNAPPALALTSSALALTPGQLARDSPPPPDLQIPQLLPSTVDQNYHPKCKQVSTYVSPKSSYNWDERKLGDGEPSIIGGMATTDSNSYLGAASSAALINLVGGGFFMVEKPHSPGISPSSTTNTSRTICRSKLERYITDFFDIYHVSYPIVYKPVFLAQFNDIIPPPPGWHCLLYIVAAIGSFMAATSPEDTDDLALFEMAKSKLSIEHLETGSITLVQTLTLMSNYLQKRDRPNSGYNYLGLAVRMAMGLGLHKQIDDTEELLLTQEMKRRVWWCLYIFDCGQTITYGRPLGIPCAGIDARLPLNILDTELTALSTRLPQEQNLPTIYTSVRLQSLFHLLTNCIYERIITDPFPTSKQLFRWDEQYLERWKNLVPEYFQQEANIPTNFQLARAVLGWRFSNLRIIMYRTFLLKNVVVNSKFDGDFDSKAGERCLQECSATISSMARFWDIKKQNNRMDAWYSLYFLIPAVLMPLVCLRNNPVSTEAGIWRNDIQVATEIIQRLIGICPSAGRILNLIESLGSGYLDGIRNDEENFAGTDESPFSQLLHLHTMLWPGLFDIEQQFLS